METSLEILHLDSILPPNPGRFQPTIPDEFIDRVIMHPKVQCNLLDCEDVIIIRHRYEVSSKSI